jgi:hypothetical protein
MEGWGRGLRALCVGAASTAARGKGHCTDQPRSRRAPCPGARRRAPHLFRVQQRRARRAAATAAAHRCAAAAPQLHTAGAAGRHSVACLIVGTVRYRPARW